LSRFNPCSGIPPCAASSGSTPASATAESTTNWGFLLRSTSWNREGRLTDAEHDRVQEVFGWFNEHLQVPRLREEHWRARFWFWHSAQPMIRRLWDVVAVLRHCDVLVELLKTSDPGTIVYGDQHQVAAIPRANRRR
jgi:hypothetical protein